jgi:branched-subunit amino acid transport protein
LTLSELTMIAGMALVTFGIRYVLLPLSGRFRLSPTVEKALGYSPPAVLTAIVVPAVLMPEGEGIRLSLTNAWLVGAIVTAAVAWVTRNLMATIVLGMAAFLLWRWGAVPWLALNGFPGF